MKCEKCNGKQYVEHNMKKRKDYLVFCNHCYGKEDLDWLDNIIGVDYKEIFWFPPNENTLYKKKE